MDPANRAMSETNPTPVDPPSADLLVLDEAEPRSDNQRGLGLGLLIFALFAPLALLVSMLLMDLWMGAPGFTRDYVVRFDLPPAGALAACRRFPGQMIRIVRWL
jgi:hypothetical protein